MRRPEPQPSLPQRLELESVASLMSRELVPPRFAVEGLVPVGGVTVLAGRPKARKSFLALDLALGVATGTPVLGDVPCREGPVLYLGLEDGEYRMQRRIAALLGGELAPDTMFVAYRWCEGLAGLVAWAAEHPGGLIVIDVLAKFATIGQGYQAQYQALGVLNDLARRTEVAILIVTHTTKARSGDPFVTVLGSTAMTAAADAVLILEKLPTDDHNPGDIPRRFSGDNAEAGSATRGLLHCDGKDVDHATWALGLDGARWVIVQRDTRVLSGVNDAEFAILNALGAARDEGHDSLLRRDLQKRLADIPGGTLGRLLSVLVDMQLIDRLGRGRYQLRRIDGNQDPQ